MQYLRLQQVRVLVFVDEYVIEPGADICREVLFADELAPVQQQVVVVECLGFLLALDVMPEQRAQLILPVGTPGISLPQRLLERFLCIDTARIDREAGVFPGEAPRLPG